MRIDNVTGLLTDTRYIASPNCDDFPPEADIDLLVIHCISLPEGCYDTDNVMALFTNQLDCQLEAFVPLKDLKVSAHVFVRRDGECLQFVPFTKRAWHAGRSSFAGRENCNDFSIGIELEGTDKDEFTEVQYQRLAEVTNELRKFYPNISRERITAHSTIAPLRKTDPGIGFNWQKYLALLT